MAGASLRFRSWVDSRSCRSTTSVLTSTTSTARADGNHANTSIEPRSPRTLNVCSGNVTHQSFVSRAMTSRTVAACRSSRSRGRSAPRQRGETGKETPTAAPTRLTNFSDVSSRRPCSISETSAWLTPAASATSRCRRPRRIRTDRMAAPTSTSFMPRRMVRLDQLALIARFARGAAPPPRRGRSPGRSRRYSPTPDLRSPAPSEPPAAPPATSSSRRR